MLNFNKYVQKGEAFINEVATQLGDPDDKARASRILRTVLRAFRDRLTPAESMQMVSQLPMLIKAVYVNGWKISGEAPKSRHIDDFIEIVRSNDNGFDFTSDQEALDAIHAVSE